MARYRKIDPRIWNDAKFMRIGPMGQMLFLYVLTHPNMTMLGMLRSTKEAIAFERGWDLSAYNQVFDLALTLGLIEYDTVGLIACPNFLKYNEPESITVVKSWGKIQDFLPECDLYFKYLKRAKEYLVSQKEAGKRTAVLCESEEANEFPGENVLNLGKTPREMAANLYGLLREAEKVADVPECHLTGTVMKTNEIIGTSLQEVTDTSLVAIQYDQECMSLYEIEGDSLKLRRQFAYKGRGPHEFIFMTVKMRKDGVLDVINSGSYGDLMSLQ